MDEPARFRQSGNAATPRTTSGDDGVTGRVHALREALADHPYLRHAMVVPTAGDLPVRAQAAILERGVDPLCVRGVYAGDRSYLVAANLQSVEQGITTALHEAVGHEGVRAVLGDRFEPVMETLYDTFPRQHDAWTTTALRYGYVDTGTRAGRVEFAEELTAHLAEANVEVGEFDMVRAEVRSRIREDFPSLPFTDADAQALIQRSRESLILRHGDPDAAAEVRQRQERRAVAAGRVINYNAAKGVGLPDALSLALHRDGSQVLDKDGIPCRLYHGTGQEIDRVEGTFWGTVDPALANEYSELRASMDEPAAVIPYYANIRRPFDGDALKAETNSPTIVTFARQLIHQAGLTGADAEAIKAQAGRLIDMADREESGPRYAPHDFWYRTRSSFGRAGAEAISAMYEAAGFDGVRYTELGHLTYGAFSPGRLHFLDQGASPKGWQPDRQHGDGLMTERPDFQQWFHGSQAATSAGAPVVLYHGTQTSIEHDLRAGKPLYLTDSPAYANYYAAGESGASPQSFQANPTYTAGDLLPEEQEALVSRAERDYLDAQGLVSDDDLAFYSDHKAAPVLALWDALNAEEQAWAEQRAPGTWALVERFQDIEARMEQSSHQSFAALDTLREMGRKARIATPNVVPVYASIQAPYRVENEMEMYLLTDDPGSVEHLKAQGYDSAIWTNPGVEHLGDARGLPYGSEVLVFSPEEQIRSVYAANTPTRQAGDVRFSLGGAPEYRLSLSSAMDEVSILRPRVEASYGEGRLEEAERLDARLETLYQRLEDGYLAMEEDGPDSDEPMLSRSLLESAGDVTDDEASFEQDFGNRYHALFYGHEGDFMDTADKVATLRGVAEDYGALYGGLRKDVTDNDILDAAAEAYRDQVARHQRPSTSSPGGHDALTMAKLALRAGMAPAIIKQQTGWYLDQGDQWHQDTVIADQVASPKGFYFPHRLRGKASPDQLELALETVSNIASRDPYANMETRPGTLEKQREHGRSALQDLCAHVSTRMQRHVDGANISLLGASITQDLAQGETAALIGQSVTCPDDLATLAQIYRDPRFETLRYILMKGDEVIGETAVTSRLPSTASAGKDCAEMLQDLINNAGADGYYLVHNHPSGSSTPSPADESLTRKLCRKVPGFRGHVVIDYNEYSLIDGTGLSQTFQAPDFEGRDFTTSPTKPHSVLGLSMVGPHDVAEAAKRLNVKADQGVFIGTVGGLTGRVCLATSISDTYLDYLHEHRDDARVAREGLASLRQILRAAGVGGNSFFISPEKDEANIVRYGWLVEAGLVLDVVSAAGKSLISNHRLGPRQDNPFSAAARSMRQHHIATSRVDATTPTPEARETLVEQSSPRTSSQSPLADIDPKSGKVVNHTAAGARLKECADNIIDLVEEHSVHASWIGLGSLILAEALNEWSGGQIEVGACIGHDEEPNHMVGVLSLDDGSTLLLDGDGLCLPEDMTHKLASLHEYPDEYIAAKGDDARQMAFGFPMSESSLGIVIRSLEMGLGPYEAWEQTLCDELGANAPKIDVDRVAVAPASAIMDAPTL